MKQGENKRASTRPSMRRELMELFRDTRSDAVRGGQGRQTVAGEADSGHRPAPSPGPSRFLRRFLATSAPAAEPARSGLARLDDHLGGGFRPGLHLVTGEQAESKTAFLESLAWEAVSSRRPTLYYSFRNGSLRVWERLIFTLGAITEGDAVTPSALRNVQLVPTDKEALVRLDAELQRSVLPYLSLFDRPPGPPGNLSAFLERLRSRGQEAAEAHGRLPLVLIDDLEELAALTGSRSLQQLLARLDAALAADSLPGVLTGGPDPSLTAEMDRLDIQSFLTLRDGSPGVASAGTGRVDAEILRNEATGWTGSVGLLLDPSSGLFAEVAAAG
jgi:hypothetical protein